MGYLSIDAIGNHYRTSCTTETQENLRTNAGSIFGTKAAGVQETQVKPKQKETFKRSRVEYDTFEFFPNGKIKSWTNAWTGDGAYIKTKKEYNENGKHIRTTMYNDGYPDSNKVLWTCEYNYDKRGNLVSETRTEDGKSETYAPSDTNKTENVAEAQKRLTELRQEKGKCPQCFN